MRHIQHEMIPKFKFPIAVFVFLILQNAHIHALRQKQLFNVPTHLALEKLIHYAYMKEP